MNHLLKWVFLLSGLLACAAPAGTNGGVESGPAAREGATLDVQFRVVGVDGEPQEAFEPGETVTFSFTVTNRGTALQRLAYTFPPHRVDVIDPQDGQPVWQAWEGRMFPQVMRHADIAPGESEVFSIEWQAGAQLSSPGQLVVQPAFHGFLQGRKLDVALPEARVIIE